MRERQFDAIVVGAGFGGLAAALGLAERGVHVLVLESLRYPGGCASTFVKNGYRFEAGATLFSGFGPGQLFERWIREHRLDVYIDWLDPVVRMRSPALELDIPPDRDALLARFASLPGADPLALARFFDRQRKVGDALWPLFDEPLLLPPFGASGLLGHLRRSPRYLSLVRWVGRSLEDVSRKDGLWDFRPLRHYLDALCQITVQCDAQSAEAPLALAACDYYFRGTGHVRGGIGRLAWELASAIETAGGSVRLSTRVRRVERDGRLWRVDTRDGCFWAPQIALNTLPQSARSLLGDAGPSHAILDRMAKRVERSWGAAMLYRVVRAPEDSSPQPIHLDLVDDVESSYVGGNHVFCSISGAEESDRAPQGFRTMTASTHVPMKVLRSLTTAQQSQYIGEIQARMRSTIARWAPEYDQEVALDLSASPRTFERFTGRYAGYVGGPPRTAGLSAYRGIFDGPIGSGLHIVGDSVFPGQSTLATALSGVRCAERIASSGAASLGRFSLVADVREARAPS